MKNFIFTLLSFAAWLLFMPLAHAQIWFNDDMGTISGNPPQPWINMTAACNPPGITNQGMLVAGIGTATGTVIYSQGSNSSGAAISWNTTSTGNTGCTFTYSILVTGSFVTVNSMSFQVRRSPFGSPNIAVTLNGNAVTPTPNTFANLSTFIPVTVAVPTPVTVTTGNTITVVITFSGAIATNVTQVNRLDDFQINGVVPVELEKFEVKPSPVGINLTWSTASEDNSSHFGIEHSTDGRNYEQLGQVAASGDSRQRITYNYTDTEVRTGTHYYRLHMVDLDGRSEYSPVRSVTLGKPLALDIWPNPATTGMTNARMHSQAEGMARLQLYDSGGRLCYEANTELAKGDNTLPIPTSQLPPGTYWLQVRLGIEMAHMPLTINSSR